MDLPDRIRAFNKHVVNPVTLKIAAALHSPMSVVHHVGRRSGKRYKTPVIAARRSGAFVFALTYGEEADWYRNVRAAGRCTLRWHGETLTLERPKAMTAETALPAFALLLRVVLRVMGTKRFFTMVVSSNQDSVAPSRRA